MERCPHSPIALHGARAQEVAKPGGFGYADSLCPNIAVFSCNRLKTLPLHVFLP